MKNRVLRIECSIFFTAWMFFGFCGICSAADYNHDYSQTWTSKMFLSKPDGKGGSDVNLTFEQALELIRRTDNLTLGVPKIMYLVGWQYKGHDDGYPAFFEVNPALKRSVDTSAEESLRWLMREAKKYHTTVSLHINMTDAYDNSPLWNEYVNNDLISKDKSGNRIVIGEYNGCKAYQINYKNEWNKGYTRMRIDRLLQLLPELKEAGTIHIDAWIARPSEGHNETIIMEAEYQKKALAYWKTAGLDVTSEWVMDYMTGSIPLAWHFNAFSQQDYLTIPACVYTGVGINPDIRDSDHDLGFLFGTSCYGEPFWRSNKDDSWESELTEDFMLKCPQYFYLNKLRRLSVEGMGKDRIALFSENTSVSLADSIVKQGRKILRNKNTISFPATWRNDFGVIVYTTDKSGKRKFDIPFNWGGAKEASLYTITSSGLQFIKKVKVSDFQFEADIKVKIPYYVIPLPQENEFSFTTSDPRLQQTFDWAKTMAFSCVGASNDPVGPWYEASLPQREAFCMRDISHQSNGAKVLGLNNENFNMFAKFAQNISESKDWCTYWEINRYNKPAPIDYRNDKEFWYNLNANFDVLDACYRTYLWTGDQRYINDKAFLTFYEKTMTIYMERWQLQADKIMDRPRFMNSPTPFNIEDNYHKCRGLASYVENFEGLTVSADLLAAIYRGCISYSKLLKLKGDEEGSRRYVAMAEEYVALLESRWWDDSDKLYNTFFTDQQEFHKGEGETFLLWFGISKDAARIRATLTHILSSDWNIENLSYFPKMLYSYACDKEAYHQLITLPAMQRSEYPEVSYGVMDGIVGGMAGIEADAGKKQIRTLSRLTSETGWIYLQHLPVMGGTISVRHDHANKTTFTSYINQDICWKAVFPGLHTRISCNGELRSAMTETDVLGNVYSYVELEVKPKMQVVAICE